jgi:INO80 complex subunit C
MMRRPELRKLSTRRRHHLTRSPRHTAHGTAPAIASNMAPLTAASDEKTHQALLDKLDIYAAHKPFRNPHWKPAQRRNKNLKQVLGEASRKEASVMATQNNSGVSTPAVPISEGGATPASSVGRPPNIAQAAQSLSSLVLEKNGRAAAASAAGPAPTYMNIESAPSFHPSSQKKYCDVTGLPAPYTDPKTRLRYHNKEIFGVIRTMPQNVSEGYLEARGAHTVLK